MYGTRICLLAALIVGATLAEAAEDYVVPAGVSVLTEDQLLTRISQMDYRFDDLLC